MKTHHISAYVLIALGVLFALIVLVTHGIALLLLLPLAMIVGPLILLFMTTNERTDRSGK